MNDFAHQPFPSGPLEEALRRACQFDAQGHSAAALERAIALARLLPQPSEGGLRAWFDRVAASLAQPTFDESQVAVEGVRRLISPRARGWQGKNLQVELEMEPVGTTAGSGLIAMRGQIAAISGTPAGPCLVAAVSADGSLLASCHAEADGYFSFEVPERVHHVAIAAANEVMVLDNVLGTSGEGPGHLREGD